MFVVPVDRTIPTTSESTWIEDSVMITAEHLRTNNCRAALHDDHASMIWPQDGSTPREVLVSPPPVGEGTIVSMPLGCGVTTEEPLLPRSEDATSSVTVVNVRPPSSEETVSALPPGNNTVLVLPPPPPEGEENKTFSSSTFETPLMSPEETMSLLSHTGRGELTSLTQGGGSQYQRKWSLDDSATPNRSLPPTTRIRRAVTCRDRSHSKQQVDVSVLRRGGGGSFHTQAGHHSLHLPPSECLLLLHIKECPKDSYSSFIHFLPQHTKVYVVLCVCLSVLCCG